MTSQFDDILDFRESEDVASWMDGRLAALRKATSAELLASPIASVKSPDPQSFKLPLGPYSSSEWRRFAMAAFVADWACYQKDADRADFPRLLSVIAAFPGGFRVWLCRVGEAWTPVGYTGWYPISKNVFDLMRDNPSAITHRGFMVPLRELDATGNYIYLFNYSIVPQLQHTAHSKVMLSAFARDLSSASPIGNAAVTVSPDGARVAQRFGLTKSGCMYFDGEAEDVYVTSQ